ncbi:hypothetical protein E2C01_100004 [Portunus trituberculatus]|uniref:Uncharacterized protein n=1 Tax=Portunus trituberculatus TaxID=210409 RepID=A0A5B7KC71_PORTR|nr:hypothetical protein [Portunus trituberculatus]
MVNGRHHVSRPPRAGHRPPDEHLGKSRASSAAAPLPIPAASVARTRRLGSHEEAVSTRKVEGESVDKAK